MNRFYALLRLSTLMTVLATTHALSMSRYPKPWLRQGECLDHNSDPLQVGVRPDENENVLSVSESISSLDECVSLCMKRAECNFFTFYYLDNEEELREDEHAFCELTGFNLGKPCFNLDRACVLLKECNMLAINNCTHCHTGLRPLVDPVSEPLTVLISGVVDAGESEEKAVYSEDLANVNEMLLDARSSCVFSNKKLTTRQGAFAFYYKGNLMVCGGYTMVDGGQYLDVCERFDVDSGEWVRTMPLQKRRAFASVEVVGKNNKAFVVAIGGYNEEDGVLDSLEILKDVEGEWSMVEGRNLPKAISHGCSVLTPPDVEGRRHIWMLGGWDGKYLSDVYRIDIDAINGQGEKWIRLDDLKSRRGNHHCHVVQVGWQKGVMVGGGYEEDTAWLRSVEFFDFEQGNWTELQELPMLNQARHYHGMTTLNMRPAVMGGWNDGALRSVEMLDDENKPPQWRETNFRLKVRREKFATARVPRRFAKHCYP